MVANTTECYAQLTRFILIRKNLTRGSDPPDSVYSCAGSNKSQLARAVLTAHLLGLSAKLTWPGPEPIYKDLCAKAKGERERRKGRGGGEKRKVSKIL